MNTRPIVAAFCHVDGQRDGQTERQTDRHDEANNSFS